MPGRRWGAAGLAAMLLLAGCAQTGHEHRASADDINGVRTDPDHQGLVVSYLGGECDGPAQLEVAETPTRIDADVVVGGGGSGSCSAVGYLRTLSARLDKPVGSRAIWSGGRQQVPFDGARLLMPSALPAGFTEVFEHGFTEPTSDRDGIGVTSTWVTRRSEPSADGPCRPTRGSLEIRLGPAAVHLDRGRTKVGTAAVDGIKAAVYREGSAKKPTGLAYGWTTGQRSVLVSSQAECPGDQVLNRTELLRVANSLRPS